MCFAGKAKVKILLWQSDASKGRIGKISQGLGEGIEKRQSEETGERGDSLGSSQTLNEMKPGTVSWILW